MSSNDQPKLRSLHFSDGEWDLAQLGSDAEHTVVKLVIGAAQVGDNRVIHQVDLTDLSALLRRLPLVTHLYLWGLKGIKELPTLPGGLVGLDVRNCAELEQLPDTLPEKLEILDAGECKSLSRLPGRLPDSLKELYLNNCDSLPEGGKLLELPGGLEVLDTTDTPAIRDFPAELLDPRSFPALRDLRVGAGARFGEQVAGDDVLNPYRGMNALSALRAWWQAIQKSGADTTPYIKIFLLGNGQAGKTQVLRWLKGDPISGDWDSTHGAQLGTILPNEGRVGIPDAGLAVWDFGGQDIYHGTHALFTDSKALYVLVWTADPNRQGEGRQWCDPKPFPYWLEYVKALSRPEGNDPVRRTRMVVSESGKSGTSVPPVDVLRIPQLDALVVSHDLNPKFAVGHQIVGGKALVEAIRDQVAKMTKESSGSVPSSWARLRDWIRSSEVQQKRILTETAFRAGARQYGIVDDNQVGSVRVYLHQCGAIFHKPGLFDGRVVVDQQWAFDVIYTVLGRSEDGLLRRPQHDGSFTREELLRTVWRAKDLSEDESRVLLEMMEQCGVCFKWGQNDRGEIRYLAPELLPSRAEVQSALLKTLEKRFQQPLRAQIFRYEFLHNGIIRSIMAKTGHLAGTDAAYWNQGFCVYDVEADVYVVVEAEVSGNAGRGIVSAKCYGPKDSTPAAPWMWITGLLQELRPTPDEADIRAAKRVETEGSSPRSAILFSARTGHESTGASLELDMGGRDGLKPGIPEWEFEVAGEDDFASSRQVNVTVRTKQGRKLVVENRRQIRSIQSPKPQELACYLEGQSPISTSVVDQLQRLGRQLASDLQNPGEEGDYEVARAMGTAKGDKRGVRFVFRGENEFHRVPWELVQLERGMPFSLSAFFQRQTSSKEFGEPLFPVADRLKLLWVTSRPTAMSRPSADVVWNPVREQLQGGGIEVCRTKQGSLRALYEALNADIWHAVHLDMHGDVLTYADLQRFCPDLQVDRRPLGKIRPWEGEEGVLFFESEEREMVPVRASELGRMISTAEAVPLLAQNSCKSGMVPKSSVYSSIAWQLVRDGIPGVVGFQGVVTVDLAIKFFTEFYQKLDPRIRGEKVRSGDVEYAVREARKILSLNPDRHGVEIQDWWLPVFYGSERLQLFNRETS